jgi:hypothetical protein
MYIMDLSMSKNWIDTHFHVFNAGVAVEDARYVPQYSAQLSDWMKQAQNVGVTRGVWVQPSFLGTDNSLMIDALKCYPAELRGIAVVSPDACIEHLETLHQSGVRGIRLNLSGVSHDIPEWTRFDNIWCHGDWCEWTPNGGLIIHGRSDATLNPGGVRIGAPAMTSRGLLEADFEAIGDFLKEVADVCVDVQAACGSKLLKEFTAALARDARIGGIRARVEAFSGGFAMPGFSTEGLPGPQ